MARRMRRYRRRGARRGRGRKIALYRRPAVLARKYQGVKYFTEMFYAGTLATLASAVPGGGWFTAALNSPINHPNYFSLYDLGTITRYDVMLIPNSGDVVWGTSPPAGSLTVSENQNPFLGTAAFQPPTSQIQILGESNSRIVPLDGKRTLKFVCRHPQPAVSQAIQPNGSTSTPLGPATVAHRKSWTWMNLNNTDAQSALFGGIKFWVQSAAGNIGEVYSVYIRIYLAFKEQQ